MSRRLQVVPGAVAELSDAIGWYEQQRPGLGIELVAQVDLALQQVVEAPEAWPSWPDDPRFRKRTVKRFPYLIFYTVSAAQIRVVAFAHARREPGYWRDRLEEPSGA